ncbi:MAG TPA: hypothetical protein VGK74_11700 [Symbiobacteriaceae bacterium]
MFKGFQYRTVAFMLLFLVLLQVSLDRLIPAQWVFHYRVDYETIKNDMGTGLDRAMDRIAREIQANPAVDYIVLLGDSVAYSGPGGAEQSIAYYLEQWSQAQGHPLKVYTLAQPGMMLGDVYTELLMLKEHRIPLNRVVIDTIYTDYRVHPANDPWFGWLGDDLRRLDPTVWAEAGGKAVGAKSWMVAFRQDLLGWMALWRDRDILRARIYQALRLSASAEIKDVRPWTEKAWLKNAAEEPAMQLFVDPRPVDLSAQAESVGMWQRILGQLDGAKTLVFFSPVNPELLGEWLGNPGYQQNLKRIDGFFAGTGVDYVNWATAMPSASFTDHVHLVPEGYRDLAAMLGERLLTGPTR